MIWKCERLPFANNCAIIRHIREGEKIMSFKKDMPNFSSLIDTEEFYFKSIPSSFWDGLEGMIRFCSENAEALKANLNAFSEIIPCESTHNWGWDFLVQDIPYYIKMIREKVKKGKIDILMDCLAMLVVGNSDYIDKLNDFLQDEKIGYHCESTFRVFSGKYEITWYLNEQPKTLTTLQITQEIVKSDFQQAYEEYGRAVDTLKDAANERARKDAVRSCINAMESIVKICGDDDDIKNATSKLKTSKKWGKDYFIKQGLSIFNKIHELYPDLRHGSTETSEMPLEEAEYWINAISAFINYMVKYAEKNHIE